jgi:hypothetical protein
LATGDDTLDAGEAFRDVEPGAHDVSIHQYAPGGESFTSFQEAVRMASRALAQNTSVG